MIAKVKPSLELLSYLDKRSAPLLLFSDRFGRGLGFDAASAMTVMLGKRKRRKDVIGPNLEESPNAPGHDEQLQSLLRQHFETKFEPLESYGPLPAPEPFVEEDDDFDASDTDWTGLSGDEEGSNAVVIDYQKQAKTIPDMSKDDMKVFMVLRA